jgi:protein-tyrosine phosphatase
MIIPASDVPTYNLGRSFTKGVNFIKTHIQHTNVYVHCFAGVSRSGAMTIAYLMKTRKMPVNKALSFT